VEGVGISSDFTKPNAAIPKKNKRFIGANTTLAKFAPVSGGRP
jgi:hypothetical protein